MNFPTDIKAILNRVQQTDPVKYAATRNFTKGDVTYLSPYISRGVISGKQVLSAVIEKGYSRGDTLKFIQEFAWREYFQRTWQQLEDDIFTDILVNRNGITNRRIPAAMVQAKTGIHAIDDGIKQLYETGYLHNHLRMYVASVTCNLARSYWDLPSQWMYYHLLDGDIASNTCSWQWVAGNFSSKKYYCNQENINRYTQSQQHNTFLDKPYEMLFDMSVPEKLTDLVNPELEVTLPESEKPCFDTGKPLLIYNSYNLDPFWRAEEAVNRVLLLEPSHFKNFPVSNKVIHFILSLAKNIPGIQVFTGEAVDIPGIHHFPAVISKEHPAFKHYPGLKDERDWMFPEVKGFYSSFFSYWKKCAPLLRVNTSPGKSTLLRAAIN